MTAIDEVRQRTDILEVIGRYLPLTKAGKTFRGLCPFHGERNPSFYVYPEQQTWHCFGCNSGGDVFSFLMKKENIEFKETLRLLAEKAGVELPTRPEERKSKEKSERLFQTNEAAARYFHDLLLNSPAAQKARDYLAKRDLSAKSLLDFRLGFSLNGWQSLKEHLVEHGFSEAELLSAGLIIQSDDGKTHDRFRGKLMFPIMDAKGHVIAFGARVLDDSTPKYINSPQSAVFDKSGTLYGINLATTKIKETASAVIVEGYIDVIIAHQFGFSNVVATMGTSVTEQHINTLRKLARAIIFALDADVAGAEALLRVERTSAEAINKDVVGVHYRDPNQPGLSLDEASVKEEQRYSRIVAYAGLPEIEVKVVVLPHGKDPDEVIKEDPEAWRRLLSEAQPILEHTFGAVAGKLDLSQGRDKMVAVSRLLPLIAELKNDALRDHYLRKLTKMTGTSYNNLESSLKGYLTKRLRVPVSQAVAYAVRPLVSSPIEEYCLALLLQHPELKGTEKDFPPEYFESSENREIFVVWREMDDLSALKERLDTATTQHMESLMKKSVPAAKVQEKYTNCVLRLRERYLRSLESKKAEILASEAQSGGTDAELAKLQEQGIETSIQLGEIFARKGRKHGGEG